MRHALSVGLISLALAACAGGNSASVAPDADAAVACETSGRADTYVAGLAKQGSAGLLSFKLVQASPSPPARYLNAWTIQINAVDGGAPTTGATLTVTPWMPDHQHGAGAYTPKVEEMSGGAYDVQQINTWMPGYWEITVDATAGSVHDTAVYKFCISA